MLAKGINEFYRQEFESAETHIRDYLDGAGSKAGLANFYLGVSMMTRYYLAGASPHAMPAPRSIHRNTFRRHGDCFGGRSGG